MKQIEITTRVNNSLKDVKNILRKQGFKIIRKSRVKDIYMTQKIKELKKSNILEVLQTCILLRYLKINGRKEYKKITYKNKVYDKDIVISEEKINLECDNLEKAQYLFEVLDFKNLIEVEYEVLVMKKDKIEFAFQDVKNLGLLLEYENPDDFGNKTKEEILKEKHKMLEEIKSYKLNITEEIDVKKAYELIENKFFN